MDSVDFWLLDSVLELRQPLEMLLSPAVEKWFNRPGHGLAREELTVRLAQLFVSGQIIASEDSRGDFVPNADELEAALNGDLGAYYGLTAAGGAAWESVAQPDWDRYIDECYGETDSTGAWHGAHREQVGELVCARREYLEKYLAGLPFLGIVHLPPSIIWDTLTPWPATYWKTLPAGQRIRFFCVYAGRVELEDIPEWFRAMKIWHGWNRR